MISINLKRINGVHFETVNQDGLKLSMDGPNEIGGNGMGMRPTEVLLSALAGCSSIDAVTILQKGRNTVDDYQVEVTAERATDKVPAVFTSIHMKFIASGSFTLEQMQRAVQLSVEKYCTVAEALSDDIKITHESVKL